MTLSNQELCVVNGCCAVVQRLNLTQQISRLHVQTLEEGLSRGQRGGNCSPMVLLGVEPVALREFHRRLHGNPRPLHGSPDVSYWNTWLPPVAATYETHMWFAMTLRQLESRCLRRWTNAAADVTCQAASTFPVASSPLQDEVFVVLFGHPQFEGIFEQNLFGFEPHCSKRQGPTC